METALRRAIKKEIVLPTVFEMRLAFVPALFVAFLVLCSSAAEGTARRDGKFCKGRHDALTVKLLAALIRESKKSFSCATVLSLVFLIKKI